MTRKDRILWMIAAGSLGLGMILIAASCHVLPTTPPDAVMVTQTDQTLQASLTPESFATVFSATPPKQVVSVATRMAGKIVGKLSEENGCLRVGDTLAWPPEFVVSRQDNVIRVVGGWGKGEVWEFHIGKTVIMGGGGAVEFTDQERELLRIPAGCAGPYWVFGGGLDHQVTPQTR